MVIGVATEGMASRAHLSISLSRSCTVATSNFSSSTVVVKGFLSETQESIFLLLTEQLVCSFLLSSTKKHYY